MNFWINIIKNDNSASRFFHYADIVTRYHIKESYPNPTRILPPRDEIKKVLEFADQLLDRVCTLLNISTHEIKSEPN
jgi:hypothetical protein